MVGTACTEPQCLYKVALYLVPLTTGDTIASPPTRLCKIPMAVTVYLITPVYNCAAHRSQFCMALQYSIITNLCWLSVCYFTQLAYGLQIPRTKSQICPGLEHQGSSLSNSKNRRAFNSVQYYAVFLRLHAIWRDIEITNR
jgi:hypothetical protein